MDSESGTFISSDLNDGRFIHFSADNIDINESTIDGKNTFHATYYAAWQRGPCKAMIICDIAPCKESKLTVPDESNTIFHADFKVTLEPCFDGIVEENWFDQHVNESHPTVVAQATDLAFILKRQNELIRKTSWTTFNESHSVTKPELTTVCFLPIIQAPAHDIDAFNTVVIRIIHIAKYFGQKYAVLTVHQALFPHLMEFKWTVPEYIDVLIPRLGGLHIRMNFFKVIGKHMQDSGLSQVWSESGLLGQIKTDHVMEGKDYSKAARAHKITYQALWQLVLPQLLRYLEANDNIMRQYLLH